jgi:hypothetical protein
MYIIPKLTNVESLYEGQKETPSGGGDTRGRRFMGEWFMAVFQGLRYLSRPVGGQPQRLLLTGAGRGWLPAGCRVVGFGSP